MVSHSPRAGLRYVPAIAPGSLSSGIPPYDILRGTVVPSTIHQLFQEASHPNVRNCTRYALAAELQYQSTKASTHANSLSCSRTSCIPTAPGLDKPSLAVTVPGNLSRQHATRSFNAMVRHRRTFFFTKWTRLRALSFATLRFAFPVGAGRVL